jgi:hypothetical protein
VDQVLFLPAILLALHSASKRSAGVLIALNAGAVILLHAQQQLSSPMYLWTGPAWMGWCWWVERRTVNAVWMIDYPSVGLDVE